MFYLKMDILMREVWSIENNIKGDIPLNFFCTKCPPPPPHQEKKIIK